MRSSTIPCKWSDYNPVTGKEGVTFITRRFTCQDIAVSCIIPCTLTIIQKFKDVIIGRSTPSPSPVGGGGIILFSQNLLAVYGIVLGVVPILVPFVVIQGIRGLRCRLTPGEKRPDFLRLVRAHVTGGPFQAVAHLDIHMTVDHVRLQSAIHGFKRNEVEVVYYSSIKVLLSTAHSAILKGIYSDDRFQPIVSFSMWTLAKAAISPRTNESEM